MPVETELNVMRYSDNRPTYNNPKQCNSNKLVECTAQMSLTKENKTRCYTQRLVIVIMSCHDVSVKLPMNRAPFVPFSRYLLLVHACVGLNWSHRNKNSHLFILIG